MVLLTLLLCHLSLAAGVASLTGAVIIYLQHRKKVIIYYGMMLLVASLLVLHRLVELYTVEFQFDRYPWSSGILTAIENIAYCIGVFIGPFFMHNLLGIGISKVRRYLYLAIGAAYLLSIVLGQFFLSPEISATIRNVVSLPLLFGIYAYCLVMGSLSLGKLGSVLLKQVIIALFAISLLILPFSLFQYLSQKPFLPYFMERPILFILLFIITLIFSINYFNRPAYLEKEKLSAYFKERFSITDREAEIILEVTRGHSNQAIADALFISTRTVESHLYSIFQKLGVKNRVQLANLIQTNR
jgi:DNA-binding CsgD family transcriptional regulator